MTELVKPKFKMSFLEMLRFSRACDEAARECPQYDGSWSKEDQLLEAYLTGMDIDPKELVKHWLDSTVLWDAGYSRVYEPPSTI